MTMTLLATARAFLQVRCDSLLKDVRHCVLHCRSTPDWPAPFPALLYCFSTIDLLGALYAGNATHTAPTTTQARQYMLDLMKYPTLQANLLQLQFRHKLVHLAQPQPRVQHGGVTYLWAYHHHDRIRHLQVVRLPNGESQFWVSITSLAEDVAASVSNADGYLDRLAAEAQLQANFQKAYDEITT